MLTLNNKGYFLTYSQCDIRLETLLLRIKEKFHEHCEGAKVSNYVIADEEHKDGGRHRHCFIDLNRAFRGKVQATFLDIEGHHPNIEYVRSNTKVIKYCIKDGQFISNMQLETKVTKEEIAKELINGNCSLVDIVTKYPKYLFGYSRLKQDLQMFSLDRKKPEHLDRPCGIWIAGPSGSGKSTIATRTFGEYYFKGNSKWWDGYNGEETVVCEDVDLSWKDIFALFKIWADSYSFIAEVKGGTVALRPKRIVVTSNRRLEELMELMNWPKDDYMPYVRRFREYWIEKPSDWEDQL